MAFENDVRKCVANRLKRGKIDVFIQQEGTVGEGVLPVLNLPLAKAYAEAFDRMKQELGLNDEVTLELLAAQRDVIGVGGSEEMPDALKEELLSAVGDAVDRLDAMRVREGAAPHGGHLAGAG